ncbi:MAG: hypothetical protein GWN71_40225, partial [Gammaproteobacteria bacterium]|nr:hypothetical protein [Gemmatimonadota bacterium]NIU79548.1 hypothetical protein [Gammaproteobacteria bacterium]
MKIRLFLTPTDGPATLLELDLPGDTSEPCKLRAFTPPPSASGGEQTVARAFDVDAETVSSLADMLEGL